MNKLRQCWMILCGKGTIRLLDDDPWCPYCCEMAVFEARLPFLRGVEIEGFKTATGESLRCDCKTCDCKKTLEEMAEDECPAPPKTWTE